MTNQQAYQQLTRRLKQYRRRKKTVYFFEKFLLFLALATTSLLSLPLLYAIGGDDQVFRWLVSLFFCVGLVYSGWHLVVQPLAALTIFAHNPPLDKIALEIGNLREDIRDRLCNAFQLVSKQKSSRYGHSEALIWAAFARVQEATKDIDFNRQIETRWLKRNAVLGLLAPALALITLFLFPARYSTSFTSLLRPDIGPEKPKLAFHVLPGDARVIRGENLPIVVQIENGGIVRKAELIVAYQGDRFRETIPFVQLSSSRLTYQFENITEPFSYTVRLDRETSPGYHVEVIELPEVQDLQLTLHYPQYSGLQPLRLDPNVGNVTALKGTRVELDLLPNKPLLQAFLIFAGSDTIALRAEGEVYRGQFSVMEKTTYSILLRDTAELVNHNPIEYQLTPLPDQNPIVDIVFPGKDIDLDESMQMPIVIEGEDDYGFSRLSLMYEIIPGGSETKPKKGRIDLPFNAQQNRLQSRYIWDLLPFLLLPDDAVAYQAVLYDNDTVSGPKAAYSKKYRLRYPSVREIFSQTAEQQQETVDTFEQMSRETREIEENVQNLMQEMLRQKELDWQDRQKLKENLSTQKEMQDRLERAKEQLDDMIDRLERNDLLSLETLEKYQELQELLKEISTPELQKMLEKLQSALEKVDPKDVRKALEELKLSQEEFRKSLEKTINLLKQLQAEQRLAEALKMVEEMQQHQDQINQRTAEAADSTAFERLARKEFQQQERLSDVKKSLDDVQKRLQELPNLQKLEDRLRKAREMAADNASLQSEMRRMLQQLRRGDRQKASQAGENISQQLQEMYNTLSQAQEELQQQQRSQVMQALQRGSHDLLQLSKRQEQLKQTSGLRSQATSDSRKLAEEQQNLLSGMQRVVNQLFETSQTSFFVPPEINRQLGKSLQGMQNAIRSLESEQNRQAAAEQGKAMEGLNGAVAELRKAMQALNQSGGGGSGLEQLMQRLSGMSSEQQGINQQTEQLGNQGLLSPQQQASLARLAAQQEALRKSLEELAKEFAGKTEILGSLDRIAQDMGYVAEDLSRQNINRETLERQRRILSRLLDAQRSAQQRDVSRRRRAETGKQYTALDPGALPDDLGEAKTRLQQDLLKAMREKYANDYKVLIQKYFEALTRELQKSENRNNLQK